MIANLNYVMAAVIFTVGLYAVLVKRDLIKIIIGIGFMEYGVNLFWISLGYRTGGTAPIITPGEVSHTASWVPQTTLVDPIPQALVLTAIVIGLGTTVLLIAIAVRAYQRYGTFDIQKMRELKE
ncbi:MAG: cation:proton antiporter [Euryarchaeota archaeon]|nr:cation:proton antiporter [Euryarchaeota archaeon]